MSGAFASSYEEGCELELPVVVDRLRRGTTERCSERSKNTSSLVWLGSSAKNFASFRIRSIFGGMHVVPATRWRGDWPVNLLLLAFIGTR